MNFLSMVPGASVMRMSEIVSPPNPLVLEALNHMPIQPTVPVEVINIDTLTKGGRRRKVGAGVDPQKRDRIYLSDASKPYKHGDTRRLASMIAHENIHVRGISDEARAYRAEADTLEQLGGDRNTVRLLRQTADALEGLERSRSKPQASKAQTLGEIGR